LLAHLGLHGLEQGQRVNGVEILQVGGAAVVGQVHLGLRGRSGSDVSYAADRRKKRGKKDASTNLHIVEGAL
jgi:hypothetical protein